MSKTLVRPTSKGQVTIPKSIRDQLGVKPSAYLSVHLENGKVIFQPVEIENDIREYTDEQIAEFSKVDKISRQSAKFANKLLGTNKY